MKPRFKTDRYPGTQAVGRALSLLRYFSDARPAWGLTQLATVAGLNKSTTYRLLSALEQAELVARDPVSDSYRLGPGLIALGALALRSTDLIFAARPELEALAHDTGETATLEVLTDDHVLVLDEALGRYLVGAQAAIGRRWPAHATSTGKVLLAALDESARGTLSSRIGRTLPRFTPRTITTRAALARELEQVTKQGYAVNMEELELGYVAIGAPVRNHEGNVIAAVSLGAPVSRLPAQQIPRVAKRVRAAAASVSRRLGSTSPEDA